jgi:hypothetical protein
MIISPQVALRSLRSEQIESDLVIVGGGMAGTCAAITAARAGLRVSLVQDRPVLGGNASSEVRLWILGATSHQGNNNRWAREGGVIDEILVENIYRNPEGNPLIFDTILLEKVVEQPRIRLLLNTAVFEVEKSDPERISAVRAFCSQNSMLYELHAPLFCDASGDGVVSFLAGAAFRMGAEAREEFGEGLAPSAEYGELLGHTLYFYSKDAGRPIRYTPPSFALADISAIPRFRSFNAKEQGCKLWWIEYGGRLDTVHDTETIKWELWKIVYGVWDYIKNSGQFPEAANLTLEWVGHLPGKRESRRFEGDYMLTQHDVVERPSHADAVAHGGWALDLHPADGIYSERPGCNQWHSRGVYQIPYRCLYSRSLRNLFLAGRIISASHVAFSSTRVQGTLAHAAQAVGMAAAHCHAAGLNPADLLDPARMRLLQRDLLRAGQFIPGLRLDDPDDLARQARVTATSTFAFGELPADGPLRQLAVAYGQLLPLSPGPLPTITLLLDAAEPTSLEIELRATDRPGSFSPGALLERLTIDLPAGERQPVTLRPQVTVEASGYILLALQPNPALAVHTSALRLSGTLALMNGQNRAVSNFGAQEAPPDSGVESFPFWIPERRPGGQNLALSIAPPLEAFAPSSVTNGWGRPLSAPNAWVADPADPAPALTLRWERPQTIGRLELGFDTDFDHAMESVLMGHPERAMPGCVRHYRIEAGGELIAEVVDNHQTRNSLRLARPLISDTLTVRVLAMHGAAPAALFELRCYEA